MGSNGGFGRPPRKHPDGSKMERGSVNRHPFSVRLLPDIRERLIAEAAERRLPTSELIEQILWQYFEGPALADAIADRLEERQRQRDQENPLQKMQRTLTAPHAIPR